MNASTLELTRAEDLMNRDVISIGPRDSIQEAITLMSEHHVSGIPVVDRNNCCVGVLSASDVLSFVESEQEEGASTADSTGQWFNAESMRWESVALSPDVMEEYGSTLVEDVMTTSVISVLPETPAAEVATEMDENSVHRVLVVDQQRKLHGVISAFDFVRLAAASARE